MRLAIISDIHANLEALTKAFELIDQSSVDEIICLGDIVGYGANPNECLQKVQERCKIILLGNHDDAAVDLSVASQFTLYARLAAHWTHNNLRTENKEFLKNLPLTAALDNLLFVHASPYEPEEWHYILSQFEAREAFSAFSQQFCFVGHSHVPVIFSETREVSTIDTDGRYIINVGSVGQPRDGNPRLSFGIFDTTAWKYENIREKYDWRTAAEKIRGAGLPRALADRLILGI